MSCIKMHVQATLWYVYLNVCVSGEGATLSFASLLDKKANGRYMTSLNNIANAQHKMYIFRLKTHS